MVENHGMRPPTGQTLPPSRTHTHTVTVDAHKLPPTTRPRHVSNRVGATFRCRRGSLQVDSGRGSIAGEYILRYKPRRPCHVSSSVLPTLVYIDMCYNEQGESAIDHKLAHIDTCVRGQSRRTQGGLLVGPGGACVRAARLLRIRKSKMRV